MRDGTKGHKVYILCAAILFNDDKEYLHQPVNIDRGYVICGQRHHNCYYINSFINRLMKSHAVEGFLTNKNEFITRDIAAEVAWSAGQIKEQKVELYSEDLY